MPRVRHFPALPPPHLFRASLRRDRSHCLDIVIEEVTAWYDLEIADIRGRSQIPSVAWARHVAMFFARDLIGVSVTDAGRLFDRDHSSISYGVQSVRNVCRAYPKVQADLDALRTALERRLQAAGYNWVVEINPIEGTP